MFNSRDTQPQPFYDGTSENVIANVPMMNGTHEYRYEFVPLLSSTVLEMSYAGCDNFSMIIVLPEKHTELSSVWQRLQANGTESIFNTLMHSPITTVNVFLPRFNITKKNNMKDVLTKLELHSIFSNAADLSKISNNLYVSEMEHTAMIEVNEEGSEASASTGKL